MLCVLRGGLADRHLLSSFVSSRFVLVSILERGDTFPLEPEFSGSLVKQVNGKTNHKRMSATGPAA
jgi:hypothetical protein